MLRRQFALLGAVALLGCAEPAAKPYYWKLVAIDGAPFTASARIAFPETADGQKRVIGDGPCNSFSGTVVSEPFPTTRIEDVVATERACADMAAEQAFFSALSEMTGEGVGIGYLYFVNDAGRRMDFKPEADLNPALNAG